MPDPLPMFAALIPVLQAELLLESPVVALPSRWLAAWGKQPCLAAAAGPRMGMLHGAGELLSIIPVTHSSVI